MEMSTLERHLMLLEVSTPQHRGLSCTWTCLENSSLCCSCTVRTYTADACASLGIVYTLCIALPGLVFIKYLCAAPEWNSSILGANLNQVLSVQQSSACAVPGLIYRKNTTETCSACLHTGAWVHLDLSTQQIPVLHRDMFPQRGAPGRVQTAESCAAPRSVYFKGPELHLDVSTLQVMSFLL